MLQEKRGIILSDKMAYRNLIEDENEARKARIAKNIGTLLIIGGIIFVALNWEKINTK